jgi:hypothetical protein
VSPEGTAASAGSDRKSLVAKTVAGHGVEDVVADPVGGTDDKDSLVTEESRGRVGETATALLQVSSSPKDLSVNRAADDQVSVGLKRTEQDSRGPDPHHLLS